MSPILPLLIVIGGVLTGLTVWFLIQVYFVKPKPMVCDKESCVCGKRDCIFWKTFDNERQNLREVKE